MVLKVILREKYELIILKDRQYRVGEVNWVG